MTETDNLEIVIKSIATGSGFATAGAEAKVLNAELSTGYGSLKQYEGALHSGAMTIGLYGENVEGVSRRLGGLHQLMNSTAGQMAIGLGGAAALGIGIEAGRAVIENTESQEKALASLSQAATASGRSYRDLNAEAQGFIQTNRAYISDQYEATTALAMFTRAGFDNKTSMEALNVSLDLASLKGISLADSAHMVDLALMGNGRAVRELGIDMKALTAEQDTSETATKNVEKAQTALTEATKRLAIAQQGHNTALIARDTQAVAEAQQNLTAATNELGISESKRSKILDELSQKTAGGRDSVTQLQRSQNELNQTWQNATTAHGPALIGMLSNAVSITDSLIQANEKLNPLFNLDKGGIPPAVAAIFNRAPTGAGDQLPGGARAPQGPNEIDLALEGNVTAAQRRSEAIDRLGNSVAIAAQADMRHGEILSTTSGEMQTLRDETDRLTTRNAAQRTSLYDLAVGHNELSTAITNVLGKWRDEDDAMTAFKNSAGSAIAQTTAVFDGFVAHVRSEKTDINFKVEMQTEAAQATLNNFLENNRNRRINVSAGFVDAGGLFNP